MIKVTDNEVCFTTTKQFEKTHPLFSYNIANKLNFGPKQCDRTTYVLGHDHVEYKFKLGSKKNVDRVVQAITQELELIQ